MRESCCAAESEFECLFEEEAAKDHEIVPVTVLGLHYLGGMDACGGHIEDVFGFAGGEVGICWELSQRVHWVGVVGVKAHRDTRAV